MGTGPRHLEEGVTRGPAHRQEQIGATGIEPVGSADAREPDIGRCSHGDRITVDLTVYAPPATHSDIRITSLLELLRRLDGGTPAASPQQTTRTENPAAHA
jgi:hypothetical protein